jgi:endoglucanase
MTSIAALTRRRLLAAAAGAAAIAFSAALQGSGAPPEGSILPRWRGFNLYELMDPTLGFKQFQEFDFDTIAEWGFNFVRLPCSYWYWADPQPTRWLDINDDVIARTLDAAIAMGRSRGIHVNLCLHRIPGYCVGAPAEALSIWSNEAALEAAAYHWTHLARRYQDVPSAELSFNLLNEPPDTISVEQYLRVHRRLLGAVRAVDSKRLVIIDGMNFALAPPPELAEKGVAVSMHAAKPFQLTHYRAPWFDGGPGAHSWPMPTWPLRIEDGPWPDDVGLWDRDRVHQEAEPFVKMQMQSRYVGVHIGEFGVFRYTPHNVALRWMSDHLELWRALGWGWALWNLRGGMGVLDSGRTDVKYEYFRGHRLDRQMLELLRADEPSNPKRDGQNLARTPGSGE